MSTKFEQPRTVHKSQKNRQAIEEGIAEYQESKILQYNPRVPGSLLKYTEKSKVLDDQFAHTLIENDEFDIL